MGSTSRSPQWLGLGGVVGFAAFTAAWVVASFLQEGYSARREEISGLAAETAEHAWIMIAGFVVLGAGATLLGVGLLARFGGGFRRRIGPALVVVAGVGIFFSGVFRNDCSSLDDACSTLIDANEVSWHHYAHDAVGIIAFLALIAAPALIAGSFRRQPGWASLRLPSLLLTPILVVLLVLFASEAFPGIAGLLQRAFVLLATGWLAVVGARLYATSSDARPPRPG